MLRHSSAQRVAGHGCCLDSSVPQFQQDPSTTSVLSQPCRFTFATDLGKRAKVCFSRPIAAWLNAPEMDIRLPKLPSCLKN